MIWRCYSQTHIRFSKLYFSFIFTHCSRALENAVFLFINQGVADRIVTHPFPFLFPSSIPHSSFGFYTNPAIFFPHSIPLQSKEKEGVEVGQKVDLDFKYQTQEHIGM